VAVFVNYADSDPVSSFQEVRPTLGTDWTLRPIVLSGGHTSYIYPDRKELVAGELYESLHRRILSLGDRVIVCPAHGGGSVCGAEIFRLAKENNVPCWSSSSLRFGPGTVALLNDNKVGKIMGCDAFSPCSLEEHLVIFLANRCYGPHFS
jgi:hypothetical protein